MGSARRRSGVAQDPVDERGQHARAEDAMTQVELAAIVVRDGSLFLVRRPGGHGGDYPAASFLKAGTTFPVRDG